MKDVDASSWLLVQLEENVSCWALLSHGRAIPSPYCLMTTHLATLFLLGKATLPKSNVKKGSLYQRTSSAAFKFQNFVKVHLAPPWPFLCSISTSMGFRVLATGFTPFLWHIIFPGLHRVIVKGSTCHQVAQLCMF